MLEFKINWDKNMGKVWKYLLMEIYILGNINRDLLKAMVSIIGIVEHFTEVIFCEECVMVRGHGK
jgi:hypothetical protein